MDSAGDVMTAARAAARPVATVESGGAAGVHRGRASSGRAVGADDVISFDMGGTTAKAGIVRARPAAAWRTTSRSAARAASVAPAPGPASPSRSPSSTSPRSARAVAASPRCDAAACSGSGRDRPAPIPGPRATGGAASEPTVTDADLVLGYLSPTGLAGGVQVSVPRARDAIDAAVARPLGVDTVDAARAVHDIVNANMAAAIRVVTVQRGIDPRTLTLVGFGGAGPMHVAASPTVRDREGRGAVGARAWPRRSGWRTPTRGPSVSGLSSARWPRCRTNSTARSPTSNGTQRKEHDGAEGSDEDGGRVHTTRAARMRVRGQAHDLDVPLGPGTTNAAELTTRFRGVLPRGVRRRSGGRPPADHVRVRVVRTVAKHSPVPAAPGSGAQPLAHDAVAVGSRDAWFTELDGWVPTSVYDWTRLAPGARLTGPAVVEGTDTTVVVPPDCSRPRRRRAQPRPAPRGRLT